MLDWILSLGTEVRVLAPEALRTAAVQRIDDFLQRYQEGSGR